MAAARTGDESGSATPVTFQQLKDSWPEILETVLKANRAAWIVVYTGSVRALAGDVLTLTFPSQNDVDNFRQQQLPGQGVSEYLRQAIVDVIGLRVKYIARVDATNGGSSEARGAGAPAVSPPAAPPTTSAPARTRPLPATQTPASSAGAGNGGGARSGTVASPGNAAAVTTSWPVVAIPVSVPESGDEPVRAGAIAVDIPASVIRDDIPVNVPDDIPEDIPEGDVPDYDPTVEWAGAGEEIPLAAGPSDEPQAAALQRQPASTPPLARVNAPQGGRSAASDRPVPQFAEKQRYGEAVVREILGASFIEERPVAPRAAPTREG